MVAQHKVERKSSPAQYALQGEGHVAPKSSRDLYYALVNFYQNEQPFFSREGNIVTSYMGEASTARCACALSGAVGHVGSLAPHCQFAPVGAAHARCLNCLTLSAVLSIENAWEWVE